MTYREAIQIQIKALQELYDNANGLRDVATNDQKEVFNKMRSQLPDFWGRLQKIDNSLSDADASYQLKGNYSIVITEKDI